MYDLLEVEFPHTEPESMPSPARAITRRVHASEEAWARHANAANGFGAGASAFAAAHAAGIA